MSQALKPVRPSIKAIIVRDAQLLVIANRNAAGQTFYILPGGGQEPLESAPQALQRECLEEIGVDVQVGGLLYVRDYIAKNHQFAHESPFFHGLELMFKCSFEDGLEPQTGGVPTSGRRAWRGCRSSGWLSCHYTQERCANCWLEGIEAACTWVMSTKFSSARALS